MVKGVRRGFSLTKIGSLRSHKGGPIAVRRRGSMQNESNATQAPEVMFSSGLKHSYNLPCQKRHASR